MTDINTFIYRILLGIALLLSLFSSCQKEPKTIHVTGVSLDKSILELTAGDTYRLTPTVIPINATNQKIYWKSNNPFVATVDYDGDVSACNAGETTVSAISVDGNLTATCQVTVKNPDLTNVVLGKYMFYMSPGETDRIPYRGIHWKSSNNEVATISELGVISSHKAGYAVLTGEVLGKEYTAVVNCNGGAGEAQTGVLRLLCRFELNTDFSWYPKRFCTFLAYPQSDDYQKVLEIKTNGEVCSSQYPTAKLARYEKQFEQRGTVKDSLFVEFKVETHSKYNYVDSKLPYREYDKDSEIYKQYTVTQGEYIYWENTSLQGISDQIWSETGGNVIAYAYSCYLYTATHFSYIDGGFPNLKEVLVHDGGDCGGFTLVYLSLLRCKGIPCRPVVCLCLDGGCHVWSEFYMEDYGWVPVDATFKSGSPYGEYFGVYRGGNAVMNHDYYIDTTIFGDKAYLSFVQICGGSWYWNIEVNSFDCSVIVK